MTTPQEAVAHGAALTGPLQYAIPVSSLVAAAYIIKLGLVLVSIPLVVLGLTTATTQVLGHVVISRDHLRSLRRPVARKRR